MMKKLREMGILPAIGFLFGTLGQIAFWRFNPDLVHNYSFLPFLFAPLFSFISAWLMVGKVNFENFIEIDRNGNRMFNVFLAVGIVMLFLSIGISIEALLEI